MEASALHPPAVRGLAIAAPLLRLRSDEQLVALFRAGHDEAFRVLHDRYRQRLFAYVRQMLSAGSRQDAEDVLQDVFVRAYGSLRGDSREMHVRAWLYRVAHNRCIDHLRRPVPAASDIFETSRKPLHDPIEEAQRRDDLHRLVQDVARLPEQQRSALLMREIHGMSYQHLAVALDTTVPAVKSLLVRARVGLVEAAQARDADCAEIRRDLTCAYDRGVKASGRSRRHLRECQQCREYRAALRGMRRSFAALAPAGGLGPLAVVAQLLGLGGGGAAAGSGAAAGGGMVATGLAGTATACKVAAVVCTAALTAGSAVEVQRLSERQPRHEHRGAAAAPAGAAAAAPIAATAPSAPVRPLPVALVRAPAGEPARPAGDAPRRASRRRHVRDERHAPSSAPAARAVTGAPAPPDASGGVAAPLADAVQLAVPAPAPAPQPAVAATPAPDQPAAAAGAGAVPAQPLPAPDPAAVPTEPVGVPAAPQPGVRPAAPGVPAQPGARLAAPGAPTPPGARPASPGAATQPGARPAPPGPAQLPARRPAWAVQQAPRAPAADPQQPPGRRLGQR